MLSPDGLLARCLAAGNCPKIIKNAPELEFYQSQASLVATDTQGNPLAMPDNVRLFLLANLQHAAAAGAQSAFSATCAFPTNPLYAGPPLRALLVALDDWISRDTPPPGSRYPSRADGTLVSPTAEAVGFPKIPGFAYTGVVARPTVIDDKVMPPVRGAVYPVFVPKTDPDGRSIAGLRLATLEATNGIHTGCSICQD